MDIDEHITKIREDLHSHDLRINSVEIKQDQITLNVTDLKADRKRLMWIVLTIIVSGLTYAGLSGLEGFLWSVR